MKEKVSSPAESKGEEGSQREKDLKKFFKSVIKARILTAGPHKGCSFMVLDLNLVNGVCGFPQPHL